MLYKGAEQLNVNFLNKKLSGTISHESNPVSLQLKFRLYDIKLRDIPH